MTEIRQLPPPLPPRLDWFIQTQAGQLAQGGVPAWFHGTISRKDAENLLESQPLGSFLIRVSHSHVGYTLSYKAQSCCRHIMVKLLDDGTFLISGEEGAHTSLDALVAFYQQHPVWPHEELLTQPCGQKNPANVDYKDLFLYFKALAGEATSPACGPRDPQNPSAHPAATPEEFQATAKPVLLHQRKERKPWAEMGRAPTEEASSSCPPKVPLEEAYQKLWRSLKMLPQAGKRVRWQLKSHLGAVSLSALQDTRRSVVVTHGPEARAGDADWEDNIHMDPSVATRSSQLQASRDGHDPSKWASRLASWSEVTPRVRGWHQAVVRALASKVSKSEPRDLAEPQKSCLPEEYRRPPPFAPGYC